MEAKANSIKCTISYIFSMFMYKLLLFTVVSIDFLSEIFLGLFPTP